MPLHNFLLGHLLHVKKAFDELPPHVHSQYALIKTGKPFEARGAWYFDSWPAFDPILVVYDPAMADQAVLHPHVGARKPASLADWMRQISGGRTMFDSNSEGWKHLHDLVSPCFSTANISAEIPTVVENILVFRDLVSQKARSGERFRLEALCKNLVIDNIGNLLLHARMNVQLEPHPLAEAMIHQLKIKTTSHSTYQLLEAYMPWAMYAEWKTGRHLDRHIRDFLTGRFDELRSEKDKGEGGLKCVMDQLLEDYIVRHPDRTSLDTDFLAMATRNMRMLFFVSYDSSAAAIVYCIHNLSKNPEALARMRAEHDAVLGPNPSAAADRIIQNPALLNALPYTTAVIKESMRSFPQAQGIREGSPDLVLTNDRGESFPTDGFSIQTLHLVTQTSQRYWKRPKEFLPERFLVPPGHPLYPSKGAWRVFEFGAQACLGQQLVFAELKAALACVIREFDFTECYDEVFGEEPRDLEGVFGQRVYMVEAGAAHPLGEYPCRVSLSQYVSQ